MSVLKKRKPNSKKSWLNLHNLCLVKDLRKLIYSKLNQNDKFMVEYAHGIYKSFENLSFDLCIQNNHFQLLQWICKESSLWKREIPLIAAKYGQIEIFEWAINISTKLKHNLGVAICAAAAEGGQLEMLKYLRAKEYPWNEYVCVNAARNGHLNVLDWAMMNGCDFPNCRSRAAWAATENNQTKVLKYLQGIKLESL